MMSPNRSSKMSDIDVAKPSFMPAAVLESRMAVAVVGGALLAVGQMLVGLVEFLEPRFGLLVAGMAVGMALHRRLAESRLQLRVGGGLGDPQGFVEIAFGHVFSNPVFLGGVRIDHL